MLLALLLLLLLKPSQPLPLLSEIVCACASLAHPHPARLARALILLQNANAELLKLELETIKRLKVQPETVKELLMLEGHLQESPMEVSRFNNERKSIEGYLVKFEEEQHVSRQTSRAPVELACSPDFESIDILQPLQPEQLRQFYETKTCIEIIQRLVALRSGEMRQLKNNFSDEMDKGRDVIDGEIEQLCDVVGTLVMQGDLTHVYENDAKVLEIQSSIDDVRKRASHFHTQEEAFGLRPTDFHYLETCATDLAPFYTLWTIAAKWTVSEPEWRHGPFVSLNAERMSQDVRDWEVELEPLLHTFSGMENPLRAAKETLSQIKAFSNAVGIVRRLRCAGVHARHWKLLESGSWMLRSLSLYLFQSASLSLFLSAPPLPPPLPPPFSL